MMPKFKVGDVVRVNASGRICNWYREDWFPNVKEASVIVSSISTRPTNITVTVSRLDGADISWRRGENLIWEGWLELDPFLNAVKEAIDEAR